jgi:hypothetical protein
LGSYDTLNRLIKTTNALGQTNYSVNVTVYIDSDILNKTSEWIDRSFVPVALVLTGLAFPHLSFLSTIIGIGVAEEITPFDFMSLALPLTKYGDKIILDLAISIPGVAYGDIASEITAGDVKVDICIDRGSYASASGSYHIDQVTGTFIMDPI